MSHPRRTLAAQAALVVAASAGVARGLAFLIQPHPDWVRSGPAPLAWAAAAGLLAWAGLTRWLAADARMARRDAAGPVALALAPGLLGWGVPLVGARLAGTTIAFSRLGSLRFGDAWIAVPPGTYLAAALLGLGVTGIALGLGRLWWRRAASPWPMLALVLALAGAWRIVVFPPTGDEPYILLSADSLLHHGDPDLTPAFAAGLDRDIHFAPFREEFEAWHRVPGRNGEAYSRHGFLLPLLCLPGYACLGRLGLQALLAVAWALLLASLAGALETAGLPQGPARDALAVLAVASPLPIFSVFLGPDLPAALLVTLAVAAVLRRRKAPFLAALFLLPWIHLKGVLLGAGLALGAAALAGPAWTVLGGLALAAGVGGFLAALNGFTPVPAWPPWAVMSYSAGQFSEKLELAQIPVSGLGTLFDRHQGLVHFPLLLLVFAGEWRLLRDRPRLGWFVALAAAPFLAVLLLFSQWTGGPGAPARMLVVILPLAIFPLSAALDQLRTRAVGPALRRAGFGLAFAALLVFGAMPALLFVSAKEKIESVLQARFGLNPLGMLPDLAGGPPAPATWAHAAGLLVLLAAATVWLARSPSKPPLPSRR